MPLADSTGQLRYPRSKCLIACQTPGTLCRPCLCAAAAQAYVWYVRAICIAVHGLVYAHYPPLPSLALPLSLSLSVCSSKRDCAWPGL